jgi:CubicO group peptidase (beta-lactamase class C family)
VKNELLLLAPATVCLFAARAGACPGHAATTAAAVAQTAAAYKPQATGFCIAAIANGTIATQCEGETVLGNGVKPDSSTLFEIGSITENMTGTLLALRISHGSIGLPDAVGPKIGYAWWPTAITVGSLAHHTSGLPRNPRVASTSEADFYKNADACVQDATCWDSTLGYEYSNYGFELLGDILADLDSSVVSWAAANEKDLMTPLGMTSTRTYEQLHQTPTLTTYFNAHAASGHSGSPLSVTPPNNPPTWGAAGGALYSSIDDMMIWLQYNMNLVGPLALRSLLPTIRTGLGWTVNGPYCVSTGKYFDKIGSTAGFNSYIGYDSVGGRGVVVLVNDHPNVVAAAAIGHDLMDSLP